LNVATSGPHTIVATASGGAWTATATVNVNAVDARMTIDDVEQTQGIQFFDYDFQGSGAGPDNSVPLVAEKATILRTYVPYTQKPPNPTRASGELSIGPNTLLPSNGPIRLRDDDDIDRGKINDTLNFLLPPNMCVGTLNCTIRVFDPDRPGARLYEDDRTLTFTFLPTPRLRIHGVLIHYTRPGFNIPAPTSTAFTATLDTTARVGPTHQINYTGFTVIDFAGDLTAPPSATSACGPGWSDLITTLRPMRTASGTADLYVALLPTGVPIAPGGVAGCGSIGVAAGPEGNGFILMHEVGHALGRMHAPCPATVTSPDPAYPTFTNPHTNRPPYPAGNIGEYAFNLATNDILAPQDTFDVMGGCPPRWISPYTFVGMRNTIVATQPFGLTTPFTESGDQGAEAFSIVSPADANNDYRENLHLIVRLYEGGNVEFLSAFHVLGPSPVAELGPVSSVTCELLGEDGAELESARLYEELLQVPGRRYTQYFGTVPWDSSVAVIALTRGGETLYTRSLESSAPRVQLNPPEPQDNESPRMRFSWVADVSGDTPVTYIPRYSNDDGESWRTVGPEQTETSYELALDMLPGGERCRFQILAYSDVRTSVATSDAFNVRVKPTIAQILSPADNAEVEEGELLLLHGRAFSPDFGTTPAEEMLWFSNRDGWIGAGSETVARKLSRGRHELTLRVPDGLGGESEHVVTIHVTGHAEAT
jgi:hypothetical protein